MKYTKYPELKAELKTLAKEIRYWKHRRDHWMEYDKLQWYYQLEVLRRAHTFRIKHIAYCLLRGRKYEEIEQPAKYNKPSWRWIEEVMDKYKEKETCFSSEQ